MRSRSILILLTIILLVACNNTGQPRSVEDFNFNWKFSLCNDVGFSLLDFNDDDWENVNLPHDWSAASSYDTIIGQGNTGYVLGGIGCYRKTFTTDALSDKVVYVLFDGIYNHSEVWVNGQKVIEHVYGYSPFFKDITPYLNTAGEPNIMTVKVDRSRFADSRWYSGSGIYRNVKLITAHQVHIPVWGTFITTPKVTKTEALVKLKIKINNDTKQPLNCNVVTELISPNGKTISENTSEVRIPATGTQISQEMIVQAPMLWDLDKPNLYFAETSILKDGSVLDKYTTTFGIRSIRFDTKKGFFLNGKNIKIKGLCIHADAGAVGVAVPKEVWRRRLATLKDGGCNALRIAHHPASDELLDLCDEMGFLVQDEFFDEWNYPKDKRQNMYERHDDYISRGYADFFEQNAEKDLKNTMLSHRNHPSIFQWSIGNEIEWTYPRNRKATGFFDNMNWEGDYFWSQPPFTKERIKKEYESLPALEYNIGETAQQLADWTRELDTTRPVTANCILPSASFQTGYADALDIVGFSYRRVMYDYARREYPNKIVMGTENLPQWHEWKAVKERDFISGLFLWTGIDYLGEANNMWPKRGLSSGLLNVAGFKKPSYHMYKALWTEKPHLHIYTQKMDSSPYKIDANGNVVERNKGKWEKMLWNWPYLNEHWNYQEDENIVVTVFSNAQNVELFLNHQSLGSKNLNSFPDHIYKWAVPFTKGTITAVCEGKSVQINTSGKTSALKVVADKKVLNPDGYDVMHLELTLIDDKGNPVVNDDREVSFSMDGDGRIIGIDNGSLSNPYPYNGNTVKTLSGKALLIIQSNKSGEENITVTASSEGLNDVIVKCKLKK